MYSVVYFGSHPDNENDDCWGGQDFATKDEALAAYNGPLIDPYYADCTAYIMLDGPDINEMRPNPGFVPQRDDGWRREIATQAGMMSGCEGRNEVLGY